MFKRTDRVYYIVIKLNRYGHAEEEGLMIQCSISLSMQECQVPHVSVM